MISVMFFVAIFLWSCASRPPANCKARPLSRHEVIEIVQEEIRKQGGDPNSTKTSKIQIKRDGCDYIVYQVFRPKRPGGYLFVRIDEFGKVTDYLPGL
jgi:hypothetical protein